MQEPDPRTTTHPDGGRRLRVLVAAIIETDATEEAVRLVLGDDLRDCGYAVETIHVAPAVDPDKEAPACTGCGYQDDAGDDSSMCRDCGDCEDCCWENHGGDSHAGA